MIYNEKNEPFVVKGNKVYKINDGFIDNFTQSLVNYPTAKAIGLFLASSLHN
ncbi:hypothetical protein VN1249_15280 [Helicobacter pylori]|nr:hypothetical protein VN1249_15280 [Helicobacter pylori]